MNSKQRKTLVAIFKKPTVATIVFSDLEALLVAAGCMLTEGNGSRVRFDNDGLAFSAHRPHPGKEARRYQVEQAREFLAKLEITP